MNDETIARLNAINREFYRVTADEFDATRGTPWPGWERLLPHLSAPLSVLDVGCGNGRLGVFLADNLNIIVASHCNATVQITADYNPPLRFIAPLRFTAPLQMRYHGMDNNPALLDHARATLSTIANVETTFEERDIIEHPPAVGQDASGQYDLVALFGVIHHVPGSQQRQSLMRVLAERVAPGGMLAFACWRFYEYERFRERITPWPDDLADQVEAGDHLLDWRRGERALRYCHYVDDAEHAALVAATGLAEIETYRADGRTGDANRYNLLRRASLGF